MLVLGCISEIYDFKMIVSLPNGLSGTVGITNICKGFTTLLGQLANDETLSSVCFNFTVFVHPCTVYQLPVLADKLSQTNL